ncbi:hypothetical protein PssiTeo3_49780 [Pseudomonas sichuanensis]|nr:hypothetical protein [Pseudomonas sichuanensis]
MIKPDFFILGQGLPHKKGPPQSNRVNCIKGYRQATISIAPFSNRHICGQEVSWGDKQFLRLTHKTPATSQDEDGIPQPALALSMQTHTHFTRHWQNTSNV